MRAARGWLMVALAAAGCGGIVQTVRQEQERDRRDAEACTGGDAAACVALGERALASYRRAGSLEEGRPLSLAGARDRFERACTLGAAVGCLRLAETWLPAPGLVAHSPSRALPPARRACELGLAAGCLIAATATDATDPTASLLRRACALDASACPEAARHAADASLMAELAARPCELRMREACARAADLPLLPEEQRHDLDLRACALDAPVACVRSGRRVEQRDPKRAEHFFRHACNRGDRDGCASLGRVLTSAPSDR